MAQNKYFQTFAGVTKEEMDGYIQDYLDAIGSLPGTVVTNKELEELKDQMTALNAKYSTVWATMHQQTSDITGIHDELTHLSQDINDLFADKMNKEYPVVSKLYQFIRIDKPTPEPSGPLVPDWMNHISMWKEPQTVNLTPVSNDAHLYFINLGGKTYSLPILKYDAASDPIRLNDVFIPIGKPGYGITFSVRGQNAQLVMEVNINPDDVPTMQLIKYF